MRSKVRIAREVLERDLWPDQQCRVRIVGASWDADSASVMLDIEGADIPEGEVLRLMTLRRVETEFKREREFRRK